MSCTRSFPIAVALVLSSVVTAPHVTAAPPAAADESSALRLNAPRIELLPPLDQVAGPKLPQLGWPNRSQTIEPVKPQPAVAGQAKIRRFAPPDESSQAELSTDQVPPEESDPLRTLWPLRDKIRKVLTHYYGRPLDARMHNPWEVMHGIIAYGCDTPLLRGPGSQPVNAVAYMCWNGDCAGDKMLFVQNGRVEARQGPRVQGHFGQYLAILAQSRVPIDYPMNVFGQQFTLADLLESEKLGCRTGTELTFKLIAMAHYCDTDMQWKSDIGEAWSIPKLVREEIAAPIRGAPCGGTHRLTGIAYSVYKRAKEGKPIDGEYQRARKYLDDYERYTLSLQNLDGSFSTEWFARRGDRNDIDRKLQTTGHILEWFAFSTSPEMLRDPRTVRAVNYLTKILDENPSKSWSIGPLGHALHALVIYDRRTFGGDWTPAKALRPADVAGSKGEVPTAVGGD